MKSLAHFSILLYTIYIWSTYLPSSAAHVITSASDRGIPETAYLAGVPDPSRHATVVMCRHCGATLTSGAQYTVPDAKPVQEHFHGTEPCTEFTHRHDGHTVSGQLSKFKNPHGEAVSVVPMDKVPGAKLAAGTVSTQDSWYEDHGWHSIVCSQCGTHVGWAFAPVSSLPSSTPAPVAGPLSSTNTAPVLRTPEQRLPRAIEHVPGEEAEHLASLQHQCLLLQKGWWTYEFCHKTSVRQLHIAANGKVETAWSLGQYQPSKSGPGPYDPQWYTSHFYAGGQVCHETKSKRSTEVQFFCCEAVKDPASAQASPSPGQPSASPTPATRAVDPLSPWIASVTEPALCQYQMKVCLPTLCEGSKRALPQLVPSSSVDATPVGQRVDAAASTASTADYRSAAHSGQAMTPAFHVLRWDAVVSDASPDFAWVDLLTLETEVLMHS